MPDSKQLRILKKLCAHLELTPEAEISRVVRGMGVISAKEAGNILSLLEAPRPIVGQPAGNGGVRRNESWTLLLQGWPIDDKQNPSDPAYVMKAKVEQHLSKIVTEPDTGVLRKDPIYLLGGDIGSMIIGQGVVRPPSQEEASSRLAMFYIPLILEVATDVSNPYK
jgi:hypothetical protein